MHTITVYVDDEQFELTAQSGENLRDLLLSADLSPYTTITRRANCGGRGICATCGVWIATRVDPRHWHDRLARTFGYPRLSCQIIIDRDLTVHLLTNKWIWGSRMRGTGPNG